MPQPAALVQPDRLNETRLLLATVQPGERFKYPGLFPAFDAPVYLECTKADETVFQFDLSFVDVHIGEATITVDKNTGGLKATVDIKDMGEEVKA